MNYTNEMKSMVKAALDKRGWSKTEFMRRSGLARETARQIYNGVPVSIDEENAARICKALQLPLDEFWQLSVRDLKAAYNLDTYDSVMLREASAEYGFSVAALKLAQRFETLPEELQTKVLGIIDLIEPVVQNRKTKL